MLVISLRKEVSGELHVLRRLRKRVGPDRERWFLSLVADINHFMPDGWRMTKSSNNFRIQVVGSDATFAIVGESYRRENGDILSIIDTVLDRDDFDKIEAKGIPHTITDEDRKKYPELMHPNLYYFQPGPDDSRSPLFARQYERVKYAKNGRMSDIQYHRIHPLTKAGLDLDHFKWIKWDIRGNVEFVDFPDDEFHGKDYWNVPGLESEAKRGDEEKYIAEYESLLKRYGVVAERPAATARAAYERETKFTFAGSAEEFGKLVEVFDEKMKREGHPVEWKEPKEQRDTYFDDERFSLYEAGASFRLRKKKGSARVTFKKRTAAASADIPQKGLYVRLEEETLITRREETALLNGEEINVLPFRLVAYVVPECGRLKKVLEVINRRTVGLIHPSGDGSQAIEFCHDVVEYLIDGKTFGPVFEIELESKGAESELTSRLAEYFANELRLEFSVKNKYEKGISLLLAPERD